jgi:hypothetical protein
MMHKNPHQYKNHARACGPQGSGKWRPVCGLRGARLIGAYGREVDCHVCLYQLGLYMPLVKLYEHQTSNKVRYSFQKEFFYADA